MIQPLNQKQLQNLRHPRRLHRRIIVSLFTADNLNFSATTWSDHVELTYNHRTFTHFIECNDDFNMDSGNDYEITRDYDRKAGSTNEK